MAAYDATGPMSGYEYDHPHTSPGERCPLAEQHATQRSIALLLLSHAEQDAHGRRRGARPDCHNIDARYCR